MRRLRHPFRLLSRIVVLHWAWRNRRDLLRWSRFAIRLPTEVRTRDLDDLVTEARARIALSSDPRTRLASDVDITGFENGSLLVRAPGEKPIAQLVREQLALVSGVADVRIVDNRLPTIPSPTPADSPPADHDSAPNGSRLAT